MNYGRSPFALFFAIAALSGSACAMASTPEPNINCTVKNADKLPPALGGEAEVCSTIARIALPSLQRAGLAPWALSVSVDVQSEFQVSAIASVDGKPQAKQNVASSDGKLGVGSIEMLARAIADQVSKAG